MVVSKHVEFHFLRGFGQQHGRVFGENAQFIGKSAIPILRKHIVSLAKRLVADLLELAVSELAETISGREKLNRAAENVGKQSQRKQLGSGSRKQLLAE